jgi:hypothetical protein
MEASVAAGEGLARQASATALAREMSQATRSRLRSRGDVSNWRAATVDDEHYFYAIAL